MNTLAELFFSFLRIGFSSFGGLSMIPQIMREMISHGWMTAEEVADIVAIAEMTPGPLGINCATFAGMRAAGPLGVIAANLGVMAPTLTLCAAAAVFFDRFRDSRRLSYIMNGVRPACIGMIIGVVFTMLRTTWFSSAGTAGSEGLKTAGGCVNISAVVIGISGFVLFVRYKLSIPMILALSAAAGIIIKIF